MAYSICESFRMTTKRLMDLGLGHLKLDLTSSTFSTGERQWMQLAQVVRNRTTGILYVLDESSIRLHPANIVGLTGVMHDLMADDASVILVNHDTQILGESDWLIKMGPEAGSRGRQVVEERILQDIIQNLASQIGPFLSDKTTLILESLMLGLEAAIQKLFSIYLTAPKRGIIAEQEGVEADEKKLSE